MSKSVKRLFEQFVPENYKLELDINQEKLTFSGKVTIVGKKVGRPSKRLTFHQKDLQITKAEVIHHGKEKTEISVDRINTHKAYDEVRVHSPEMIYPGQYEIELEFNGKITDVMTGLYPCNFEHEGKKKKIFATQFESHHAREVFPCIDEPEAKATFDLVLTTPKNLQVLSNTEIKKQTSKKDPMETSFETSPVMSTYLLAFVFGELHSVEGKTKSNVLVRSWATVAQPKNSLKHANSEAIDILNFFEEYFETAFPLKKLDQVALPDFESGAMENWGLITYREVALLTDPDNPSVAGEQYVSMVIAHEISHQWFGNLVTMKWWDDLWLNESFASLMEHVALDKLHPDWKQWEQYASVDIISCSNRDVYSDVQSVGMDVKHPSEIGTIFDPAIVYAKGGRLLKMMREYIGDENFRKALKNYFKNHAYKNTSRADLWQAMSDASGQDITALMTPWLEQSGMPIIEVRKINPISYKLSQTRFLLDKFDKKTVWPIPLLSDELTLNILETKSTVAVSSKLPLLNRFGSGHYVVNYAVPNDLMDIIDRVKAKDKFTEARINILNDLSLIARNSEILISALGVVKILSDEKRDAVWVTMLRILGQASLLGEKNEVIENGLKKFRYELAHKNYKKLGWNDVASEDPNTKLLRATMISLMLSSEDQITINQALDVFKKSKQIEDITADRRSLVFSSVVRYGKDQEQIDQLIEKYQTTIDPDLQNSLCASLTATKDAFFAKKLINLALAKDGFVRTQDIFRWYAYLMRNKYTRDLAWDWMTSSWDRLEKQFGGGKSMDYFVNYSASPMQTKEWKAKFDKFFDPKINDISLERAIKIAKSEIQARIAWRDRELKNLEKYFKSVQ